VLQVTWIMVQVAGLIGSWWAALIWFGCTA